MNTSYQYPRPALTVDCVVFGIGASDAATRKLQVLLIQRDLPPFRNAWALPGGFVRINESLDQAAARELREETGLSKIYLEQFHTFGDPQRDPREHVVSVAHFALVNLFDHKVLAATDARDADWFDADQTPKLAFDHQLILTSAWQRLQQAVRQRPIGFELLPREFTLTQLQQLYEVILNQSLDKRNFRKKLLAMESLIDTQRKQTGVAHRAAKLYRFDRTKYQRLQKAGFHFEL